VTVAAAVSLAVPAADGGAASGHRTIVSRLATARHSLWPVARREAANGVVCLKRHIRGHPRGVSTDCVSL
jgi:hypothetical protein